MNNKLIILLFFIFIYFNAVSQSPKDIIISDIDTYLKQGIHLINKNLTIPWGTKFTEISNYGKPKIFLDKKLLTVCWDSVSIFNNIQTSLYYFPHKIILQKEKYSRAVVFFGQIDSINTIKFEKFISNIIKPKSSSIKKKTTFIIWETNHYYIDLLKSNLDSFPSRFSIHKKSDPRK